MKKSSKKNVIIGTAIAVFLPILSTIIASRIRLKPMQNPTF